jgi:hypothetical protein
MILYSAADKLKQQAAGCGADRPDRRRGSGFAQTTTPRFSCPETLEPKPTGSGARDASKLREHWRDGLTTSWMQSPTGLFPAMAAGLGGGRGKPERRLENQASNVLNLKARPLLLGPRQPLPAVEEK